jgi:NAD(P)-dependent dehydrogenase (short-subunit alcohol dehydrogenase family)
MARHGAIIFGCDLTIEPAEYNKKRIEQDTGATVDVMTANVTEEGSVKALVDACMAKHGRIDILVNNVGRSEPGGPAEITPNVWDAQVRRFCHAPVSD